MTQVLNKYNYLFLGLFVIVALSFLSINVYEDRIGFTTTNPGVYASSLDVLTQEQLTSIVVSDDENNILLTGNHLNIPQVFVHNRAYVGVDEWRTVVLTPRYPSQQEPEWSNTWIRGPADATITKEELINLLSAQGLEETEELYILMYVCRLYNRLALEELSEQQQNKLLELFEGDSGYLCGVERFTNDGTINHNKWSLTTINISGFFDEEEAELPEPVIEYFVVNNDEPSDIIQGDILSLSWQTMHATSCEATGSFPGWSGQQPVNQEEKELDTTSITPGEYMLSLACENTAGVVTKQQEITIQEAPLDCSGRQPAGMQRASTCVIFNHNEYSSHDCTQYAGIYGRAFPGFSQARQLATKEDTYLAMEFTVGDNLQVGAKGAINYVVAQIAPTVKGPKITTISKCPGDFDQALIEEEMGPNCYMKQGFPKLSVQWEVGENSLSRCAIKPGETYYYNLLYTTSPAGTPPEDLEWACGSHDWATVCSENTQPTY